MRFAALGAGLHRSPPPMLGQHNREILQEELGLSDEEIDALLARLRGDVPFGDA